MMAQQITPTLPLNLLPPPPSRHPHYQYPEIPAKIPAFRSRHKTPALTPEDTFGFTGDGMGMKDYLPTDHLLPRSSKLSWRVQHPACIWNEMAPLCSGDERAFPHQQNTRHSRASPGALNKTPNTEYASGRWVYLNPAWA